jgi:hypothetical protein
MPPIHEAGEVSISFIEGYAEDGWEGGLERATFHLGAEGLDLIFPRVGSHGNMGWQGAPVQLTGKMLKWIFLGIEDEAFPADPNDPYSDLYDHVTVFSETFDVLKIIFRK